MLHVEEAGSMDADTAAIRRWLLDEARALQEQQEATRCRLAILRSIMRLVAAHDTTLKQRREEASS